MPQQVAGTGWLTLRRVLEDVARVCPYSDGYIQPFVCLENHSWLHYQESDHIAEERQQACLGGTRRLQVHNTAKHRVKDFGPGLSEPTAACRE